MFIRDPTYLNIVPRDFVCYKVDDVGKRLEVQITTKNNGILLLSVDVCFSLPPAPKFDLRRQNFVFKRRRRCGGAVVCIQTILCCI
ncbi:hypothetical protein C1H46_035558 [Malus baccata]|uniref:Uncharacterized protein n=1 Tax=Malus baccata TaxID=106549 RepID=A0A540KXF1_MALBA|nr:hypothetical protein C1H46_035558 [Malus baccata]